MPKKGPRSIPVVCQCHAEIFNLQEYISHRTQCKKPLSIAKTEARLRLKKKKIAPQVKALTPKPKTLGDPPNPKQQYIQEEEYKEEQKTRPIVLKNESVFDFIRQQTERTSRLVLPLNYSSE